MLYFSYSQKKDTTLDNILKHDWEKDFNTVVEISGQELTNDEIMEYLKADDIPQKHIAILKLEEINSDEEALILASNLTGQDGKIREAVAFKLNEFMLNPQFQKYFLNDEVYKILLEGLMDINGSVCRMIINLLQIGDVQVALSKYLPARISKIVEELKSMDLNSKQYVLSKKNFQLYWNLEGLYYCANCVDYVDVADSLEYSAKFIDYTIREKAAKVLTRYNCNEADTLKCILKNDENYYVKNCLKF